jgi:outer membrane protein
MSFWNKLLQGFFLSVFFSSFSFADNFFLSKQKAKELLIEKSYRWKQSDLPVLDSQAKLMIADGATSPQVSFFSREFMARTNQLLVGLPGEGPLNLIGLGQTGVQVAYDLWNRAATARLKAAQANLGLGQALSRQYKNDLTFLTLLRYLNAQQAKKKLDIIDMIIQKDSELHKMAAVRLKTGFGIPLDVTRSQGLLEKDNLKKLEYQAGYLAALRDLMDLIGELPEDTGLEPFQFNRVPLERFKSLKIKIADKPEILVGERTVKVMQHLKDQAEREYSFRLSFFGDIAGVGVEGLGLSSAPTGMLGLQLSLPLYDGDLRSGRIQEASVKLSKAELEAQQIKREASNAAESLLQKLELAEKAVQTTQKQITLAEKELQYAVHKIKTGSASNLELIQAQNNLAAILDLNIQAIFAYEAAKLAFFHDIADVDAYFFKE